MGCIQFTDVALVAILIPTPASDRPITASGKPHFTAAGQA